MWGLRVHRSCGVGLHNGVWHSGGGLAAPVPEACCCAQTQSKTTHERAKPFSPIWSLQYHSCSFHISGQWPKPVLSIGPLHRYSAHAIDKLIPVPWHMLLVKGFLQTRKFSVLQWALCPLIDSFQSLQWKKPLNLTLNPRPLNPIPASAETRFLQGV